MRYLGTASFVLIAAAAAGSAASASTAMPIAQGVWIASSDKCASAYGGMVYDGRRWGNIYYYGEGGSLGPEGEFQTILSTNPAKGGFTNMKLSDSGELGYFHVKALAGNRMTLRTGAPGRSGIDVSDETLMRCDFGSLSPRMQAAVRKYAPSLAAAAAPAAPAGRPTAAQAAPAQAASPWKVTPMKDGAMAIYSGTGLVRTLAVTCSVEGGGEIYLETKVRSRSQRIVATFRTDDGGQPALALDYYAKQDLWAGNASSVVLGSLIYGQGITIDMGAMGKERISLAGSGNAIRSAMGRCLFDAAPAPAAVAPLGISPGYYAAEGELCSDANGLFYYDGRRYGMIYDSPAGEVGPIGRPKKSGTTWTMTDGSRVQVRGAGRITWEFEEATAYRLCPPSSIPPARRVR